MKENHKGLVQLAMFVLFFIGVSASNMVWVVAALGMIYLTANEVTQTEVNFK